MKKIVLILVLLMISTSSFAQKKPKLKGNKVVTDVFKTLDGFNAIEISDNLKVAILQASNNGYHLITDENLVNDINITVVDSVLKISTNSNITSSKKLEINLTVSKINKITIRDEAKLECSNRLITNNFTFAAFDKASFNLDLNATNSYFRIVKSVSGEILLTGEKSIMMFDENAFMKGNVVLDEFELKMIDRTDADLTGEVNYLKFSGSDTGTLKGKDLKSSTADVSISGSSNAYIYSSKQLNVYAKDKSSVYVFGKPEIKVEGLNDRAQIIKRDK
ncbi:GIN domain-containing protein [Lutibacter sp.]|uniref:GIN domain-containing protein n=1 Tax=Lutibacter sp. TaxID=1925666 RepID=UPI003569470B